MLRHPEKDEEEDEELQKGELHFLKIIFSPIFLLSRLVMYISRASLQTLQHIMNIFWIDVF